MIYFRMHYLLLSTFLFFLLSIPVYPALSEEVTIQPDKHLVEEIAKDVTDEIQKNVSEEIEEGGIVKEIAQQVDEFQTVRRELQVTRPNKGKGPTKVALEIFIVDIDKVDTADQSFDANLYFRATWHDPRLANRYPERVQVPLKEIWNPRLHFVNRQRIWHTYEHQANVYPSGKVVYEQRVWGAFSEPLELEDFPFDKQSFSAVLISSGYSSKEVELYNPEKSDSGIAPKFSVPDWNITDWKTGPYPIKFGDIRRNAYAITVYAERDNFYFFIQLIIPLILIVLMSFTVFWIDVENMDTQISISTVAILTIIAFRFTAGITLPQVDYITRLDYFILASTTLVFLALIQVLVSWRLFRSGHPKAARMVDYISRFAFPLLYIYLIAETLFWHKWL